MTSKLVFLDTETTGLDPSRHEVWEVAFAVGLDSSIHCYRMAHTLVHADPEALRLNGYFSRTGLVAPSADAFLRDVILKGATIVGCNPAFDTAFLQARWRCAPWKHRMISVESFAMPILGLDRPVGLSSMADMLRDLGFDIPTPDHSAAADVDTLREVYKALVAVSSAPLRYYL